MSVMEAAIGLLASPLCVSCGFEGRSLCAECSTKILPFGPRCWRCNSISSYSRTCAKCISTGSPRSVWIATNYESLAQELVRVYKFKHQRAAVKDIAKLMIHNFKKQLDPKTVSRDYLIIPTPTATSRIRQRSFGHAELLAKEIGGSLKLPWASQLIRLTQLRQLGSKRQDRLTQLSSAFEVKKPYKIAGVKILLIDDVITTGGTIIAATKALRAAGAKQVDALIFAKRL